jgi:hypothetical protein
LAPFIPSSSFEGKKVNYQFKSGPLGLGYYLDESEAKKNKAQEISKAYASSQDKASDPFPPYYLANKFEKVRFL